MIKGKNVEPEKNVGTTINDGLSSKNIHNVVKIKNSKFNNGLQNTTTGVYSKDSKTKSIRITNSVEMIESEVGGF